MKSTFKFENPQKCNALIKKLSTCISRKSDNGYFVVSETWGSCFFRRTKTREQIEIQRYNFPKAERTYTKIPTEAYDNVYYVYVNIHKYSYFTLELPFRSCIIGMYDEQPSGDYMNYCFLVYSPTGEQPQVKENELQDNQFLIKHENIDMPIRFTIYDLCPISGRGKAGHVKRIAV